MKIISWNVNGFRAVMRKGAIEKLLLEHSPDILFLQEIKCSESDIAESVMEGYDAYVIESVIKGRHGVAALIKQGLGEQSFLIDPVVGNGQEGRLQAIHVQGITFLNSYTVNVGRELLRVGLRQDYDEYISAAIKDCAQNLGRDLVLLGDLNVVSQPMDYHGNLINPTYAGMTPSERHMFEVFTGPECELFDTFRELNPEEIKFSYWSNFGNSRAGNKGWRLDYFLASQSLKDRIKKSDILDQVMGSDHAPIILEIE